MAVTLADAIVFFKGDDKQLSSDMDTAKGKVSGFAGTATKLIGGAVVGAAAAAGAAILAVGAGAMDVSKDTATAATDMAASLGLPIHEARAFANVAKEVYGNNFADSVGDAATAVGLLAQQMGLAADDPSLQTMAENAFRLRDSFGIDVAESIGTVKNLMDNFGISGEEAFDLIAKANQKGLNASGDLLESINEYSVQFASGGASAGEFFSVMESGFQNGMLGTDKAADAFKEFRVRIQDGSKLTSESLTQLGLDANSITTGLASGTLTAADAFQMVTTALGETDDKTVQFQAGVGLLGTQFEDLGTAIATNLTMTNDWAEGSKGAIDSLDVKYKTFGDAASAIWRGLTVAVTPLTDAILYMVNNAMPGIMGAFNSLTPIIEGVATVLSGLFAIITGSNEPLGDWSSWWENLADIFGEDVAEAIVSTGERIKSLRDAIVNAFPAAQQAVQSAIDAIIGFFRDKLNPAVGEGTGLFEYFRTWVDTNMPMIQQIFETVLGAIQRLWETFGPTIEFIATTAFNNIWAVIDTVMRTIGDLITLALQILTGDWEGAWGTVEGIVVRIWDTILAVVGNQLELLKNIVMQIDWGELGRNIIEGIANGIANAAGRIADAARDAAQDAYEAAKSWLGISSPSKKTEEDIGKPFAEGIGVGIEKQIRGLTGSVNLGLGGLMGGIQQPAMAGAGGMSITVNVTGDNATYEGGRAVGRGILDELRRRGA